jgi:predicted Zn-dependent peptidase
VQNLPTTFASVAATNAAIADLYLEDLGHDYYADFSAHVQEVTTADLTRVARCYIDLDHLTIVVAGNRSAIASSMRALHVGPVVLLGSDYEPTGQ